MYTMQKKVAIAILISGRKEALLEVTIFYKDRKVNLLDC